MVINCYELQCYFPDSWSGVYAFGRNVLKYKSIVFPLDFENNKIITTV